MPDDLTGLANLAELHRALERELERAGHSQRPIALVLLHLEDFEPASASPDRAEADAVLVGVAAVLRYLTGAFSEVARWDRANFGIVLPATDAEGAVLLAERVRAELEEMRIPRRAGAAELPARASFGVASFPANASDKDGLFKAAEEALRRGKGRDND